MRDFPSHGVCVCEMFIYIYIISTAIGLTAQGYKAWLYNQRLNLKFASPMETALTFSMEHKSIAAACCYGQKMDPSIVSTQKAQESKILLTALKASYATALCEAKALGLSQEGSEPLKLEVVSVAGHSQ